MDNLQDDVQKLLDELNQIEYYGNTDEVSKEAVNENKRLSAVENAFASTFTKVNRILAGNNESSVKIVKGRGVEAPAWTDGEDVYLNKDYVTKAFSTLLNGKIDFSNIAEVKGLNYHELAHMFFSPRMTDKITKEIQKLANADSDYWYAFNILEDMRAESSIIHMYEKMLDYFTYTVLKYIVDNEDNDYDFTYMLLSGRYFLPIEMRLATRSMFAQAHGEKFTKNMEDIVKKYVSEVTYTSARYDEGYNLVIRFVEEVIKPMRSKTGKALPKCIGGSTHSHHHNNGKKRTYQQGEHGNMTKGKTQVLDQKDVKPFIKELIEAVEDLESKQMGTLGASAGKGKKDIQTVKSTNDNLAEILETIEQSSKFRDDVNITKIAIAYKFEVALDDMNISGISAKPTLVTPSPTSLSLKAQIERYFRQLRIDLEQDWLRGRKSGSLDVNNLMKSRQVPSSKVFKKWKPSDEDSASAECVILLDMSGSMDSVARPTSEVMWILKQVLDKVQVRTTVLGFANQCYVLYQPNQKADRGQVPVFATGGGTSPKHAIKQAIKLLQKSDKANKFVIALTDGSWENDDDEFKLTKQLVDMVDSSNLLYYGSYHWLERSLKQAKEKSEYQNSFTLFSNIERISKIEDTLGIVKKIITDLTNKYIY